MKPTKHTFVCFFGLCRIIWLYLYCGVWLKFKSLGLPVLQIHLQNIGQEEQRVTLKSSIAVRVLGGTSQHLSINGVSVFAVLSYFQECLSVE